MNFFESQAQARKNTLLLVALFALAIIALVLITNLLLLLAFGLIRDDQLSDSTSFFGNMDWSAFGWVGLGVIVVVLFGSLTRIIALRGGGRIIAESMGGKLLPRNSTDPDHRRLLNVVEEMAIASGTPAPPVYLLEDERGINAFAAGYSPRDAVIGVTRGLLDTMNREQLQGVIAHEFSHIFNGDMRLNIQLIGVLSGILLIGKAGHEIIASPFRRHVRSPAHDKRGEAGLIFMLVGIGLLIIGYTGVFFGNLIKAAVSRQREFLADASAVQFTRNPQGIVGALKVIGGYKPGSKIFAPAAVEYSHAFFARGIYNLMQPLVATHPPLEDRIRRIEPHWDGIFPSVPMRPPVKPKVEPKPEVRSERSAALAGFTIASIDDSIDRAGVLDDESIDVARILIEGLPIALHAAAQDPFGARALIYGLFLDPRYEQRVKQLEHLQYHAEREIYQLLQKLMTQIDELPAGDRLALIDLAIAALKQLSNQQYQGFRDNVSVLARMDGALNLLEWSLQQILFNHLDSQYHNLPGPRVRYRQCSQIAAAIRTLLSVLAWAGQGESIAAQQAYAVAADHLAAIPAELRPVNDLSVRALDHALGQARQLHPLAKQRFLEACGRAVMHDGEVRPREMELLRAFADSLDAPLPLPSQ